MRTVIVLPGLLWGALITGKSSGAPAGPVATTSYLFLFEKIGAPRDLCAARRSAHRTLGGRSRSNCRRRNRSRRALPASSSGRSEAGASEAEHLGTAAHQGHAPRARRDLQVDRHRSELSPGTNQCLKVILIAIDRQQMTHRRFVGTVECAAAGGADERVFVGADGAPRRCGRAGP